MKQLFDLISARMILGWREAVREWVIRRALKQLAKENTL